MIHISQQEKHALLLCRTHAKPGRSVHISCPPKIWGDMICDDAEGMYEPHFGLETEPYPQTTVWAGVFIHQLLGGWVSTSSPNTKLWATTCGDWNKTKCLWHVREKGGCGPLKPSVPHSVGIWYAGLDPVKDASNHANNIWIIRKWVWTFLFWFALMDYLNTWSFALRLVSGSKVLTAARSCLW